MKIEDLKKSIEENTVSNTALIFKYTDNKFIALQYIQAIAEQLQLNIEYIDNIDDRMINNMFYVPPVTLQVYDCEELVNIPKIMNKLFIITKKCPESNLVVEIPKLEPWQIKDYLYSNCSGVDAKQLDYLFDACKKDIYSIDNVVRKISLVAPSAQKFWTQELLDNKQLPRNNVETVFDFTTALLNRDLKKLSIIYENIKNLDIEPLGVVTILYKSLKNMIVVGFQQNPTESNTGIPAKQIWGIQQSLKNQTAENILHMFDIVSTIDFKLKNGELPAEYILDYTVLKCLAK